MQAVYRTNNREKLKARNTAYVQTHRDRILEAKRKYNKSEKGSNNKAGWYQNNKPKIIQAKLVKHRTDESYRAIQQSRQNANRLLGKLRPRVCEVCGMYNLKPRRVDCHHKDENPLNNTVSNLKWLCSSCHGEAHSEIVYNTNVVS